MNEGNARFFFSYSREDSEFVLRLARELRTAGATLWLDQIDILGGERWDEAVEEALVSCPGMVAVVSSSSVASQSFMDEVSYALEEGKQVIPVVYRDCPIPFRLRRIQHIDFRGDYEDGFAKLLKAVGTSPSKPVLAPSSTTGEPPDENAQPIVPPSSEPNALRASPFSPNAKRSDQSQVSNGMDRRRANPDLVRGSRGKIGLLRNANRGAVVLGLAAVTALTLLVWQLWPSAAVPEPRIEVFHASAASIAPGDAITMTWRTVDTDSVVLIPLGAVAASGSTEVSPEDDTEYVLMAYGAGRFVDRSVLVEVAGGQDEPPDEPRIEYVRADRTSITEGDEVRLSWSTSGADRVELRPGGPMALAGSTVLSPEETTNYVLMAFGPGGETRQSVQINVTPPRADPPTATFDAEPATIKPGDGATLRWTTTDAAQVRIEPNIGPVEASGSRQVSPRESTVYRLAASGAGGEVEQVITVAVVVPEPRIDTFVADPARITEGESSTLSWTTSDATYVVLDPGGPVALDGRTVVSPLATTEYTLKAEASSSQAPVSVRSVRVVVNPAVEPPVRAAPRWGSCDWVAVPSEGVASHQAGTHWIQNGSFLVSLDLDGDARFSAHDAPLIGQVQACSFGVGTSSEWSSSRWIPVHQAGRNSHQPEEPAWCPNGTFITQIDLDAEASYSATDSPVVGQVRCAGLKGHTRWERSYWTGVAIQGINSHAPGSPWCEDGSFLIQIDLDGASIRGHDSPVVGQVRCAYPGG